MNGKHSSSVIDSIENEIFFLSFVDIYNMLTIHGIVSLNELPKSVLDLNQFSKTTSYKIGPHIYSLDDIEHGILRGLIIIGRALLSIELNI